MQAIGGIFRRAVPGRLPTPPRQRRILPRPRRDIYVAICICRKPILNSVSSRSFSRHRVLSSSFHAPPFQPLVSILFPLPVLLFLSSFLSFFPPILPFSQPRNASATRASTFQRTLLKFADNPRGRSTARSGRISIPRDFVAGGHLHDNCRARSSLDHQTTLLQIRNRQPFLSGRFESRGRNRLVRHLRTVRGFDACVDSRLRHSTSCRFNTEPVSNGRFLKI